MSVKRDLNTPISPLPLVSPMSAVQNGLCPYLWLAQRLGPHAAQHSSLASAVDVTVSATQLDLREIQSKRCCVRREEQCMDHIFVSVADIGHDYSISSLHKKAGFELKNKVCIIVR